MDLFGQLNEKQLEAVKETEGYVRVIAGAGSEKTKLLVSRCAYLVKSTVSIRQTFFALPLPTKPPERCEGAYASLSGRNTIPG